MRQTRNLVLIFVLMAYTVYAYSVPEYVFLQPVLENNKPQFKSREGKKFPVLEVKNSSDEKTKKIADILQTGIPSKSIRISEMTKYFMKVNAGKIAGDERDKSVFDHPLYICLMKGGNRPKCGFFLKEKSILKDLTDAYFIEMPPYPDKFEKIFAHENGHLIDFYVSDFDQQYKPVRQVHTTPAVTDYRTAFIEGWGIHFETMTERSSNNRVLWDYYDFESLHGKSMFMYLNDPLTLAHSLKRITWVRGNLFAFARTHRIENGLNSGKLAENYVQNWMNSDFSQGEIKNAQQMLSSEGVCAHLFYQLATDKIMQENYLEADFYRNFLGRYVGEFKKQITPLENVYLKMIYAKFLMAKDYAENGGIESPPFALDFVLKYIDLFPDDKERAIINFSMATFMTTVWADAQKVYREAYNNSLLMIHDRQNTVTAFRNFISKVQQTINDLKQNPQKLTDQLLPCFWIENTEFKTSIMGSPEFSISINLNACEAFELMTIPGMTVSQVKEFIAQREQKGGFSNLLELSKACIFNKKVFTKIAQMRKSFRDGLNNEKQ